jgi:hypothetical protein
MNNTNVTPLESQSEAPICVYPWLIELVGTRQALVISCLGGANADAVEVRQGLTFKKLTKQHLLNLFPFWKYTNIRECMAKLVKDGYLKIERDGKHHSWYAVDAMALIRDARATEKAA